MPRPCVCDRLPPPGQEYTIEYCRLCWLWHHDPTYQRLWGTAGTATPAPALRFNRRDRPCVHLGVATGKKRDCAVCGGAKQVPVRFCARHRICTTDYRLVYRDPDRGLVHVPWCRTCSDYQPGEVPSVSAETIETAKPAAAPMQRPVCLCTYRKDIRCEDEHCDLAPAGQPYDIAWMCRPCWLRHQHRLSPQPSTMRKITLVNHLSPGDVLCMSGAIECLHRQFPGQFATAVDTTCNAIYESNPHIVPADETFERIQTEYPLIHHCGSRAVHFLQGYVDFLREKLGVPLELSVNRPYVYLSDDEKSWMGRVQEVLGRPARYWVLNAGHKQDYVAKHYPWYQEVVDRLQGKVQFVQIGEKDHMHKPLRGVIDQIGKTSHRELIRLVYHADGVLCGITFLMHLAAAFEKPAVIVAGGREPRSWNVYPGQVLLSTVGQLPCCKAGGCWKSRTIPLHDGDEKDKSLCEYPMPVSEGFAPKCMTMISPAEIAGAVEKYYIGGVLNYLPK